MVLLALRFVLELALFATIGMLAVRLSPTGWLSWVLGLGLVTVTVGIWGLLLSPRRRIDLSLPLRVGIELALFAGAAIGLLLAGHPAWAGALVVSEVIVLMALWMLGLPPGTDAPTSEGLAERP